MMNLGKTLAGAFAACLTIGAADASTVYYGTTVYSGTVADFFSSESCGTRACTGEEALFGVSAAQQGLAGLSFQVALLYEQSDFSIPALGADAVSIESATSWLLNGIIAITINGKTVVGYGSGEGLIANTTGYWYTDVRSWDHFSLQFDGTASDGGQISFAAQLEAFGLDPDEVAFPFLNGAFINDHTSSSDTVVRFDYTRGDHSLTVLLQAGLSRPMDGRVAYYSTAPVPVPAALPSLGLALGLLGLARGRRKAGR